MRSQVMKYCLLVLSFLFFIGYGNAEDKIVLTETKAAVAVYPAALEKAGKEKKSVLLLFTGKDWCGPCQELEKNILSTEKFTDFAKKNIVFLTLDYPQSEEPTPENSKLAEEYGIEGFPTMLLADEKGKVFQKLEFVGQTTEVFMSEVEKAINQRSLNAKFLASKDEEEKKKIAKDFFTFRTDGEYYMYFPEIISFGVLENKELKAEEKIKQLEGIFIYNNDVVFSEKLGEELKKIDADKKLGTPRLFAIKEFRGIMMSHNDEKGYEFFKTNKALFKGFDLGYFVELAFHLKEHGDPVKATEIMTYILKDEEIKKNKEWTDGLNAQLDEMKPFLKKDASEKPKEDAGKKAEEPKSIEKKEEKPVEKIEDKPVNKVETPNEKVEDKPVNKEEMK